jgi:glycosyltransferase involved in cell wall biosynthesis
LVKGSLACAYVPIDEDSLGYVTMEAFSAGKCVITTSDSGGVLEIVRRHETGFVSEAAAQSIATSISQIGENRHLAIELGRAAKALLASRELSWQNTVARLLSA